MALYIADPLSRNDLRRYALQIRKHMRCEDVPYFPVVKFLEIFHEIIGDPAFHFVSQEDNEFSSTVHAQYDVEENCICLRESVYNGAIAGNGRDRMTISHELAHALLIKHSGIRLNRCFSHEKIPAYRDPEWQAKCLAGELMIPEHLARNMSVSEIVDSCCVSYTAAKYQVRTFEKERKR